MTSNTSTSSGGIQAKGEHSFGDWIRSSGGQHGRDTQIGSIGGGNHFVEMQLVDQVEDGAVAHAWGVKKGRLAIMAHSGSVGLGHLVGGYFSDRARALYPAGVPHPAHGFYALPTGGPHAHEAVRYLDALANAANFAFVNRLVLARVALRVLGQVLGREIGTRLIYDAPHNLIWPGRDDVYVHRKGACPALGPTETGPFAWTGTPVVIPGSMGDSSWLLAGQGNDAALCSACHGAGRCAHPRSRDPRRRRHLRARGGAAPGGDADRPRGPGGPGATGRPRQAPPAADGGGRPTPTSPFSRSCAPSRRRASPGRSLASSRSSP